MKKKVIIIGGGIAGMSAAHELARRDFDVVVYEKLAIAGGKARSVNVPDSGIQGRKDLPGEHGFRFFPRFYRNVIATMKEIPYQGKTVFENLVYAQREMIARYQQPPLELPAGIPHSLEELINDLEVLYADILNKPKGLKSEDLHFFAGKIWQIMTSCNERRLSEYEGISWWEFVDAANRSEAYQTYLAKGITRSLVAARADLASTRTVGDIYVQLLYGASHGHGTTDRLLNGPTNDVWIDPWLADLEAHGVAYHLNTPVKSLISDNGKIQGVRLDGANQEDRADFYLCAVPVEVMVSYLNDNPELEKLDPSLSQIRHLYTANMNGIQLYLARDVSLVNGHIIYIDSPWALTGISQPQFWPDINLAGYGNGKVKGILSLDISNWEAPGTFVNKAVKHCSKEEIIEEVWNEVKRSHNIAGKIVFTDDDLVEAYVDTDIVYESQGNENREPLLINTVNSWGLRPQSFTAIPNLLLASDYVKNPIDLATMEGANAAARQAVNVIIDRSRSGAELCDIFPLHEPYILWPWREHDLRRYREGLPWNGEL